MKDNSTELREGIRTFMEGMRDGTIHLHLPKEGQEYRSGCQGHFHSSSELFLQLSGLTDFSFPDERMRLLPGEALIVPPRVPHVERAEALGEPFRDIVILAEADTLLCHIAHGSAVGRPEVFYSENRQPRIAPSLARWLTDAVTWGRRAAESSLARGLVLAALSGVAEALDEAIPEGGFEPRLIGRARRLIRDRIGDASLSVASLAGLLSCSADYLSHRFRECAGQGLVEYIHELRMERAADLLRSTELSSKEVAWACGFSNHSYFIRVFRRRYAASPLEYRASRAPYEA
jgi:AraC-like DNA-binding protein/mannose-6-phosphate isomerase-like protein (cupin superfamily)